VASNERHPLRIFTIGHSNRSLEEFISLLVAHHITHLVDVRTAAGSRRNPQFGRDALPDSLEQAGIVYSRLPELGGFRKTNDSSENGGWRNASFRAFADYMATPEFDEGITVLLGIARAGATAIMCAEAVPWRCHRSLIADALTVRGVTTEHIMSRTLATRHTLTTFAHVSGRKITYPPELSSPTTES
jgi:uncharacterized protein (DUF488 family)